MKKAIRVIIPLILVLAIVVCTGWYLFIYDRAFTRDVLLQAARYFEGNGNHTVATWFYTQAYRQSRDSEAVAIELAEQYKAAGNFTKAEFTLTNAIADGGGIDLYIALSKTYVEQDKLLDAVRMLGNISNKDIKAQLETMRPKAPTCSPDPLSAGSHYTQYITVNIFAESGKLYVNPNSEFPSVSTDLYNHQGITLKDGENTIYAIAVDENGLVSPAAVFSFTVGGVIKKVDFADPAMENAFREILKISKDKDVYTDNLWAIREFTVPIDAKNFADLQHLAFLEKLTISKAPSGQLKHISGLTNLQELHISEVSVSADEISLIGRLPNLSKLTLRSCSLSTISGLEQANCLTYLDLSDNSLRNISPLSGIITLQELNLSHNALNDLSALSSQKNLTGLNVAYNNLSSLSPVFTVAGLKRLNAANNTLLELAGVAQLTGLTHLDVSYNTIADVSVLSTNTLLEELNISNNTVTNITGLSSLIRMTRFDFSHNQVTKLPQWDKSCALVTIDGSYNSLKSLDQLAGLEYLNNIFMDYNKNITSVNALASCPRLIQVNVYGTKVTQVGALTTQSIIVNYNPTR